MSLRRRASQMGSFIGLTDGRIRLSRTYQASVSCSGKAIESGGELSVLVVHVLAALFGNLSEGDHRHDQPNNL